MLEEETNRVQLWPQGEERKNATGKEVDSAKTRCSWFQVSRGNLLINFNLPAEIDLSRVLFVICGEGGVVWQRTPPA